ncbi:oligopeptide ABC transporter ATP-binding protein OppF [Spiroplasma melliferum]|uniref:oligopeptide ABC transporter ATP-binding protein OppF n=1 Tax=Spiroplasma melliferum TaxID=2134 RepID=UPI0002A641D0|nr:oligopeptide ABC transporter ATP-binding protein OppF [Spiroplasma melliferum]ELL44191.1 oligopeptide ABC transporter ATP-binding protein [Spiroplasma melliferum IPMB4A]
MNKNEQEQFIMVRDLLIQFRQKNKKVNAVKRANFDIYRGEIFSIVGESGSGKTTIGRAIAGVQPIKDGTIYMDRHLIRGKPPQLYKINLDINEKLRLLRNNNMLLNKHLSNYINNLKISYYRYFENKKYVVNTKELIPYGNKQYLVTTDLELKKVDLLNFNHSNNHFTLVKEMYEHNLILLKDMLKAYQRIFRFMDNLHEWIPSLSLALEEEIKGRVRGNIEIIEGSILLGHQIYKALLKLEENRNALKENLVLEQAQKYYNASFEQLAKLLSIHTKLLDEVHFLHKNQRAAFILFVPKGKRKKYILGYNKRFNVFKSDFEKAYLKELQKLELEPQANAQAIVALQQAYQTSALMINIATADNAKTLNELATTTNLKTSLAALPNNEWKETLMTLVNKNATVEQQQAILADLSYLARHGVFRDQTTIKLYYQWVGKKYKYSTSDIVASNRLLDLLNLPLIDEIVKNAELFKLPTRRENRLQKKKIQMIFQDPSSSLNDRISVEEIIGEGLTNFPELYQNATARQLYLTYYNNNLGKNEKPLKLEQIKDRDVKHFLILSILKEVGLLPEHLSRYSHEFSGGQRQRIGIARALIMKPQFIIADEPISALDVSIRAQVLNLLKKFQQQYNLTYIFVAHDLSVVRFIADRIAVIYHGQLVELASAEELFINPLHPYTRALLSAIPLPNPNYEKEKVHFIYEPEKEHWDYLFDLPEFTEIKTGHYLFGNSREIAAAKTKLAMAIDRKEG